MVVNFRGFANSAEKDEKMSIGVEEPGRKMVVNFRGLANSAEKDEKMSIGVEEPGQKMVVNFRGLANSAEKDEKMSIGVEEPRSKMVDNFELNLTCLPRTQITLPNPTYRAILIGRRIINYCSSFGREE